MSNKLCRTDLMDLIEVANEYSKINYFGAAQIDAKQDFMLGANWQKQKDKAIQDKLIEALKDMYFLNSTSERHLTEEWKNKVLSVRNLIQQIEKQSKQ